MRSSPSAEATADRLDILAREAAEVRRDIIDALYAAKGGHYGGSLSVTDLLLTLYRNWGRDRIILSKGHAAIALYAVLRKVGRIDTPLSEYASFGSPLEGHPDMTALPAVDFSTGSLGQGLAVGLGMAIATRCGAGLRPVVGCRLSVGGEVRRDDTAQTTDHREPTTIHEARPHVWVVLGDGECQEGQVWETALLAARVEADNLVAVVDVNGFQEWGWSTSTVPDPVPDIARKWAAFGWRVLEVDGHDHEMLAAAYDDAATAAGRPTVILARTVKGKGVPLIERDPVRFHCTSVTDLEHAEIVRSLS